MVDNKDVGGELSDLPNENYKKFFAKGAEIDSLSIKEWRPVHLLFYFVKKYQEYYNCKYQFKFNSPVPSKCFEIFQIKKLAQVMTSDPFLLKDYIDWAFKVKTKEAKKKLTSISFLTKEETVQWYKLNILLSASKIDRTTLVPHQFRDSLEPFGITNYGELSFAYKSTAPSAGLATILECLSKSGFDFTILDRIV
jgi:hypothetical protein